MDMNQYNLEYIKNILNNKKPFLAEKYRVEEIGIFGSFIHDNADEGSDIDILVSFHEPIDYFDFLELEEYLTDLLNIPVDLVEKQSLKPHIGSRVLREVEML